MYKLSHNFTIYNLFKNRPCSQEAELQRLNFTKEKFKLIILSILLIKNTKHNKNNCNFKLMGLSISINNTIY